MSQPTAEATKPPEILPPVPPLCNPDFHRRPEVEVQIARCIPLSKQDLKARAAITDEGHVDFLKEETLIFFMRRADRAGDQRLRDDLFAALRQRCLQFFKSQWHGFTREEREDFAQNVLKSLTATVFAPGTKGDFLEASFWTHLKRRSVTAGKREHKHRSRYESLDTSTSETACDARSGVEALEDNQISPEEFKMLKEGLAQLPEDLRKVFVLRHYYGVSTGNDDKSKEDPSKPSIAVMMGCSAGRVRALLRQADALLAKYRKR